MTDHLARRVREDLEWVAAYWPDLADARLPGTVRPWRQPDLTREQRDERDWQAALERHERSADAPGEVRAPADTAVLDTMAEILADAEELAWGIASAIGPRDLRWPGAPASAYADARPWLAFAARHLELAEVMAGGWARYAAPIAARMVHQVASALVLVHDGQRLKVSCPWCEGRTPETPAGGAYTWRIWQMPGDMVAIMCEGECEPPSKDVGTWWRGQPVWPIAEWDWLAQRLQAAEEPPARSARTHRLAPAVIGRGAPVGARRDLLDGLVRDAKGRPVRGVVR